MPASGYVTGRQKACALQNAKQLALPGNAPAQLAAVQSSLTAINGLRLVFPLLNVQRRAVNAGLEDADSCADQRHRRLHGINTDYAHPSEAEPRSRPENILVYSLPALTDMKHLH